MTFWACEGIAEGRGEGRLTGACEANGVLAVRHAGRIDGYVEGDHTRKRGVGCRGGQQGSEYRAGTVKWLKLSDHVAVDFNACMQEGLVASDG